MQLLFNDQVAPITSEIGFLETDARSAAQGFIEWQTPIQRNRDVSLRQSVVKGSLREVLDHLLPLTSVERRKFLFVPTVSRWSAYFDNGFQGADAASVVSYLAK